MFPVTASKLRVSSHVHGVFVYVFIKFEREALKSNVMVMADQSKMSIVPLG